LIETLTDAYCESLRRVKIGPFTIEQTGQELSPNEALTFLPEYRLDADESQAVSHGQAIAPSRSPQITESSGPYSEREEASGQGPVAVRLTSDDALLAVARFEEDLLKPEVVLA
jgi:hypothetical protein